MPIQKITKRSVDNVETTAGSILLRDTEVKGFMLVVSSKGLKSYAVEYRVGNGRGAPKRRYTIGRHGSPWTPDQARIKAKELLSEVTKGNDPLAARYADADKLTIAELCDLYLAEGTNHKKASTLRGDRSRIHHYLKPRLGRRPVISVTRADVERLVREVSAMPHIVARRPKTTKFDRRILTGGPGAASQCVAVLGALYSFAKYRGICSENPAEGVKKPAGRKMERYLSVDEFKRLAASLNAEVDKADNPFPCAAIRLLILTGCRKGEIIDLHWRDVDLENRCLRLRDSKTGAKIVHLNDQALSILNTLPKTEGNPYVITGCKIESGRGGIDRTWSRVRIAAGLQDVRLHDLRHSFASVAVRGGMSLPIIGALLGHKHASTTMRYAHLSAEPLKNAAASIGAEIFEAMNS
jgi:site-specific recombinase XerD